jgi:hypothetical protein
LQVRGQLTSSRPWGGAFSFLVRLAPSPLEPNNPSQINWRRPGRSTVLDRAALAAQVRPKGGARSKPRLASVRALTHPHAPSWLAGCRPNNAGRAAKEPGWAFFAQIPHIEPLHFGIRSDGIGHRLRLSLAKRRHDTFTRDAHVRLLQPRAESLSEFDSEMQWFESRRPSQPVRLQRVTYEGRSKTAR